MIALVLLLTACQPQGELEKDNESATPESTEVPPKESESDTPEVTDITQKVWVWVRFDDTAGLNNLEIEDPSLYTFILNEDGTYSIKADCNMSSGNYILEESSLKFEPGPTTLAECAPGSHYNTFLGHLGNVATYVIDGENLFLNLWADGGNLVFVLAE
jgi:heat shock protein HslJ